jgi:glycosyltransferase involved in cell wall biosynthesis
MGKFNYFFSHKSAKKAILAFRPHLVHAHYASSYGMIGRKTNFHPFFISVWGSDLFEFPNKNVWSGKVFAKNLKAADRIFATSKVMCVELKERWKTNPIQMPFGINTNVFVPAKSYRFCQPETLVIGMVKSMEHVYGVDVLIRAFAMASSRNPEIKWKLIIAGGGSKLEEYRELAARLKSNNLIQFLGKIDYLEIPSVHQEFDVFVNPSRQESFGVSVLEASSCGKPIIATRVGGLAETVQDGFTGILVSPDNPESLCEALLVLARDKEKRTRMGNNGRAYVLESFDWDKILEKMKSHYLEFGNLESK